MSPVPVASRAQALEDPHSQETRPAQGHPEDTPHRDNGGALRAVSHPGLSSTPTSPSENTPILALLLKIRVKKLQEVVDTDLESSATVLLSLFSPSSPAADAGAVQVCGGTWRIGLQGHAGPGGQFSVRGLGQQPAERAGSPPKPCVAHLQDFKLDFGNSQGKASEAWHGGMATIFQSPGDKGGEQYGK